MKNMIGFEIWNQRHTRQNITKTVNFAKERCKTLLRAKTSFVLNATSLQHDIRSKWLSMFKEYGAIIQIVYIEVPYKQLVKQNKNREYVVPYAVHKKMITQLDIPTNEECHYLTYIKKR